MERLAKRLDDGDSYFIAETEIQYVADGYSGEAADKLAKFENLYERLQTNQVEITKELEELKRDGKTKTLKFRQLLANKITNNNFLALFHTYGL